DRGAGRDRLRLAAALRRRRARAAGHRGAVRAGDRAGHPPPGADPVTVPGGAGAASPDRPHATRACQPGLAPAGVEGWLTDAQAARLAACAAPERPAGAVVEI